MIPTLISADRTLRAKIIDSCGMTCTFCHNEGTPVAADQTFLGLPTRTGRVSIYADTNGCDFLPGRMRPDGYYWAALRKLALTMDLTELHLTGGEPTLHPQLPDLIRMATDLDYSVRLTSNGENGANVIGETARAGLEKINFSVFGTTLEELAAVQGEKYRSVKRAATKLAALDASIETALKHGVRASANIVVPGFAHLDRVTRLWGRYGAEVDVRLLNSLDDGQEAIDAIRAFMDELGAIPVRRHLTAGVSGTRTVYRCPDGREITFKEILPIRLPDTCIGCRFNNGTDCHEGYYGLRLYCDTDGRYQVGVCIQRMDLTRPLEEFCTSDLHLEVKHFTVRELSRLTKENDGGVATP